MNGQERGRGEGRVGAVWARAWAISPPLVIATVLMGLGALGAVIGLGLDPRILQGAPIWMKPLKFFISLGSLFVTIIIFLAFLETRSWLRRWSALGLAVMGAAEGVLISVQAARGTMSHFNITTPFDFAVFQAMGIFIVVAQLSLAAMGVALLTGRLSNPVFASGLRGGVLVAVIGLSVSGAAMVTRNDPAQRAAAARNGLVTIGGGHTVGQPDGGPSLPLIGWSTVAGDLRPGHFLALHALQLLPLFAGLLSRRRWPRALGVSVVRAASTSYLGFTMVLVWQALRGQSIVSPDVLTLAGFAASLALGALFAFLLHEREPAQSACAECSHPRGMEVVS